MKNITKKLIIIMLLIIISLSLAYYFFNKSKLLQQKSIEFSAVKLVEKPYINDRYSFSLKYPEGWRLAEYYTEYLNTGAEENSPETVRTIILTRASEDEEHNFIDLWKKKKLYPNLLGDFAPDRTIMIDYSPGSIQLVLKIIKDQKLNEMNKPVKPYLLNLPNGQGLYEEYAREAGLMQKQIIFPCKKASIRLTMIDSNNTEEDPLLAAIANSIDCK